MKTAISVPDDVYEQAEALVRRTKRSRSEVYSQALREYVARHAPDEVTEALDRTVARVGATSADAAFVEAAAQAVLERSEW